MKPEYLPVLVSFATFIATLSVVVVGFLYNNSRITDLRSHLDQRLSDHYHAFSSRLDDFHADLQRIKDHLGIK
jgi:hypothetical protein